jgi:hypothetical protein
MLTDRTRQLLVSSMFAAVLAAHLTLFAPLTLYRGNSEEFAVDFFTMLPNFVQLLAFFSILVGLVGLLLPARVYRVYVAVLAMLGLLVWVQGNFLLWDYGPMDGRLIDWSQDAWRGWVDLAVWLIALGLACRLKLESRKLLLYGAVVVFALQLVTSAVIGVRDLSLLARADDLVSRSDSLKQAQDFSRNENVLHLIMDGFQSDIFEEIISEGQSGRDIVNVLDGFVFYRNNLGVFPYTHMSLPAILSGKIYLNHEPIKTFRQETFGNTSIINTAFAAGYEVDLAAPAALTNWYRLGDHTNAFNVPRNWHVGPRQTAIDESARLLDLALLRTMPHFVKRVVYNDQNWLLQSVVNDSALMRLDFFSHILFLQRWRESMTATRDAPVYKMFHLMLSHNPMVVNDSCDYAGQILPTARPNVLNQARCSLLETVLVLEKMKELGIYDDALIVLMGDHGAWIPPRGLKVELEPDGSPKLAMLKPFQQALALPLLAIKVPGSNGELRVSNAPTWTVDVPDTMSVALGFNEKFGRRDILTLAEDEQRERRFNFYEYWRGEQDADYLKPIQEYVVEGDVYDGASWRVGKLYPPGTETE